MRAFSLLQMAAVVAALKEWAPAGESDSRSPCPGLNTLANHGYLPHDGKKIGFTQFVQAITEGFNFDSSIGQFLAAGAFQVFGLDTATDTLDLEKLNTPGFLEHPASMSRQDQPGGDSLHVDPERVEAMLADSSNPYLDVFSLATTRRRTFDESGRPNMSDTIWSIMFGESALTLIAMNNKEFPAAGSPAEAYYGLEAPKEWVKTWYEEERFPEELGWTPLARQINMTELSAVGSVVRAEFAKL
ncbi:unnamed protein product [Clonostachys rosea f. rosea IK726]|uniref:Heme haloperoxidase family profile domain-containing protein n=2 Tax=Bionectria ochroleuca TaxID=29856 RepID=A0A0B7KDK0_BIOOC|nr:unnamed protein product [Clonostachys rosea f. rosea IK726]